MSPTPIPSAKADYTVLRDHLDNAGHTVLGTLGAPHLPWDPPQDRPMAKVGTGWDAHLGTEPLQTTLAPEEGEITDSTDIIHTKPLFEQVKDQLSHWEGISAPKVI